MYLVPRRLLRLLDSIVAQALRQLPNETISLDVESILASFSH